MRPRLLIFASVLIALGIAAFPTPSTAQPLDLSGWQIRQFNSTQTFTIPAGTVIEPGGYLILCRNANQQAFESFYGVTLGPDVIYLTNPVSDPVVPMINGNEVYELHDDSGQLVDGPTPAIVTLYRAHHRDDPELADWTAINTNPTPGSGVEPPDATFSGLVITEVNDASGGGNYVYEFVELYFDNGGSGANQPPVVSDTEHTPTAPAAGQDLQVDATAVDPDGFVELVTCYYRYNGGTFDSVLMGGTSDMYSGIVPDLPGDTLLEYYIAAEDDEGAIGTYPPTAPAVLVPVWIRGDITPGKVILFDHAHDQDAGSDGNWRIDNNYPFPLPVHPTSESDWSGQLSTWAYELYLAGHTLRSNTTSLDVSQLSDVDLLVIVEPQIPFTTEEISAVAQFVHDGGSLFVVANHNGSDRNGNGWDSASIFGGYSVPHINTPIGADVETFCGAKFGLHFHVNGESDNSISGTFTNVDTDPGNPIIHGPAGDVSAVIYHVGNVMSLWPDANPDLWEVAGHIWKDGDTGNPDVNIAAWSRYGSGKVVGFGDSSCCADGTGSEPHANNWTEPGSDNREFFMNATWWLLSAETAVGENDFPGIPGLDLHAWPNPFNPTCHIRFNLPTETTAAIDILDLRGQRVRTLMTGRLAAGTHDATWNGQDSHGRSLPSGVYLVRAQGSGSVAFTKIVLAK
jgi:hypothetical protein